jgi:glycosyltransferase involved in cell wall biosynthesis
MVRNPMPADIAPRGRTVVLFANTDWYLHNFRLTTARALQARGYRVILLSPRGDYSVGFAGQGFEWHAIALPRGRGASVRVAATVSWLRRFLRHEKVDLIHSFTLVCSIIGSWAARLEGGIARINAIAGLGFIFTGHSLAARTLRPVACLVLRHAVAGDQVRVIVQNPDDAATLVRAGVVREADVRLIRSSGVDLARFAPSTRAAGDRPLRVLLAARLLPAKGIGDYVAAARILAAEGHAVECLLAGDADPGSPASARTEDIRQWTTAAHIRWLRHVDDMPALLASVDVVVLPSYYGEGVPRSLIEAASCGLPIITTDLPGCREVVSAHGVDGLIVPPRDAPALARAIVRLDQDRDLGRRLGRCARLKAVREFGLDAVIARTVAVYDELLPGHGARVEA